MAEGGIARTEIVDRHLTAKVTHRGHEAGRVFDIVQCSCFRDLDDQSPRDIRSTAQMSDQRPQPRPVGRCQARDIDRKRDVRMGHQVRDGEIQNMAID